MSCKKSKSLYDDLSPLFNNESSAFQKGRVVCGLRQEDLPSKKEQPSAEKCHQDTKRRPLDLF